MTDHPMIFSTPMVLALLDGRKTQTRRILGPGNTLFDGGPWSALHKRQALDWNGARVGLGPSPAGNSGPYIRLCGEEGMVHRIYPRVQPGDRLWVKEAWRTDFGSDHLRPSELDPAKATVWFDASSDWNEGQRPRQRSARFIPRWASRLTLSVTDLRVQRVQDISEGDAMAEGIESGQTSRGLMWKAYGEEPNCWVDTPRMSFIRLWDTLHGPDAWGQNDLVVAYTFTVQRGNIDQVKS